MLLHLKEIFEIYSDMFYIENEVTSFRFTFIKMHKTAKLLNVLLQYLCSTFITTLHLYLLKFKNNFNMNKQQNYHNSLKINIFCVIHLYIYTVFKLKTCLISLLKQFFCNIQLSIWAKISETLEVMLGSR